MARAEGWKLKLAFGSKQPPICRAASFSHKKAAAVVPPPITTMSKVRSINCALILIGLRSKMSKAYG